MVPRVHAGGGSFSGVVAYLTHDAGVPDDRRPETSERVGMVELENLPECRPSTAARIMAGTAREADTLKRLAGVSTRGRKLDKPVYHYSLSWSPEERPGRSEMLAAARGSLKALGMDDRQALVIEHRDRAHRHVHLVVNRVSPEDGRAASSSHDARTLSRWARTWEREHGGVRCQRRRGPVLERATDGLKRLVKRQPAPPPPPPRRPRRGPGRLDRNAAERDDWAALYARQRAEGGGGAPAQRAERQDLSCFHQGKRAEQEDRERAASAAPVLRPLPVLTEEVRQAADVAEARLPRHPDPSDPSQRPLAVSDETFDRMAELTSDGFVRDTIAAVKGRHPGDAPARARAEQDYHRPAIDRENARSRTAHTSAWRSGLVESPDPPIRRNAADQVIRAFCSQLRRVVEAACREILARLQELAHSRDRERERKRPAEREGSPSSVDRLLQERERIEQLRRDARQAWSEGRYGDQNELERGAQTAENELDRKVRELPSSELREFQEREQARYPDRGGPSR